ncbi:MAG TPA: DUF533 domain-containing protein [Kofleriaceae bacterium]|nr:DUF533 domain-containing protein [Kofleriaceae bacterium]
MSFLRNMFSGGLAVDDPRRFVIEAMIGAMEADGDVTDEEMEILQKNLETHDLFADLTPDQTSRLIDAAADAIRGAGGGAQRAQAIARGLPSRGVRLTAYTMACEVCVADAELPDGEVRYLEALQQALDLSDDDAREVFEAVRGQSGLLTLEEKAAKMRDLMPQFIDCMALMAAADGEVHEDELAGVRAVLRNIPDMTVLSRDELDLAIEESFARNAGKRPERELAAIAQAIDNPADRYWTTVYMLIIALADGVTDWREIAFLRAAKDAFELSDEQMDRAQVNAEMFPAASIG